MRRISITVLFLGLAVMFATDSARAQGRRRVVVRSISADSEETKQISCIGKVIDVKGQPIAAAKVKLYRITVDPQTSSYEVELTQQVASKEDGTFTITTGTPDSDFSSRAIILAVKEGLALGWANWHRRENLDDVEITLGQAKVLAGKVADESGNPVSGAEVSIFFMMVTGGQQPRYLMGKVSQELLTVKTDAEGKFAFNHIPAEATAEFLIEKSGRATVNTFDPTGFSGGSLHYAPGQDDIKLVQPVEAKIEGIVVQKGTGKPVTNVRLMVPQGRNRPNFGQEPVVSKEDGTFTINALTAGSHTLQLVAPREELADWVAEPVEVTTEVGKTKSGVKIEVSRGGLLEVLVAETSTKKPVEKASVSVRHEEGEQRFHARSDNDGVTRIRLLAGEYKLTGIYKEGYSRNQDQEAITIEDGQTVRLEKQLTGQPKITGVVRDESGNPVEGANIKVCPMGSRSETKTDAKGEFEVGWDPRTWGGPQEMETVYYLVLRHAERNLAAAVEIEEDTKTLDIKLATGVIFTGKVVDTEGKGIAGAKINVMLRASNWGSLITDQQRGGAVTDVKGKFKIKAIPPEHKYDVQAGAEGYGKNRKEALADDAVDNQLDLGRFTLALANLSVSGLVVDVDDKPVAGARIHAYGEGQPDSLNIQTDAQGRFTIDKVCAGRIRLSANISGKTRLHGYVETEGGATEVKVVVAESGSSGRYVPKQPPSLVGKLLPELKDLKVELSQADANDKMLLVCFWDMQQRPSRHCIRQLAKQAEQLKQKGVTVVAIQASKVDRNALNEWVKKYNIPFLVGMIETDEEKTRFTWGVKSLPWLLLTDREHVVRAEGFGLKELSGKIKEITKK